MEYAELPEFSRELKRLGKKYLTLPDDLDRLKQTLKNPVVKNHGKHWNCIHKTESVSVYKIRLACRYLRATTMRVIYAQHVTPARIVFIELYYKGETENEDRERIKQYLKENS